MLDRTTPLPDVTPDFGVAPFEATTARVQVPTFHRAQAKLRMLMRQQRYVVARCGRRWGKNVLGESVAIEDAANGRYVGWFAPENRRASESFNIIRETLSPIEKSGTSKTEHVIRTITGGRVDFWSLEDENAGRGRKYHRIVIDEAAFTKPKSVDIWTKSIRPTLLDYGGKALIMSNTNGIDPDNFLYAICHDPSYGFVQFHAPTRSNPFLPREEVAALQRDNLPLVYQQEYLAEFVDWSGAAFFSMEKLLQNGAPMDTPVRCEAVYAVIDSATKTGKENDGTGVVYFALIRNSVMAVTDGRVVGPRYRLVILDWDLTQIEGALLETWLPTVFQNLEALAGECHASRGSIGAFIEDKASGMILLQQARRRGWPAHPIESKLTAVGKDERAISVSGYVYRDLVKLSKRAFDKVTTYKGTTRNHLRGQVVGFRVGDKDATRDDDLLDDFCYGIAIALGNEAGF
jgi:hypothetical protein